MTPENLTPEKRWWDFTLKESAQAVWRAIQVTGQTLTQVLQIHVEVNLTPLTRLLARQPEPLRLASPPPNLCPRERRHLVYACLDDLYAARGYTSYATMQTFITEQTGQGTSRRTLRAWIKHRRLTPPHTRRRHAEVITWLDRAPQEGVKLTVRSLQQFIADKTGQPCHDRVITQWKNQQAQGFGRSV